MLTLIVTGPFINNVSLTQKKGGHELKIYLVSEYHFYLLPISVIKESVELKRLE